MKRVVYFHYKRKDDGPYCVSSGLLSGKKPEEIPILLYNRDVCVTYVWGHRGLSGSNGIKINMK